MTGEGAFKLSGDRYGRFGEQTGRHSGGPFFVWIGGAAMPRPFSKDCSILYGCSRIMRRRCMNRRARAPREPAAEKAAVWRPRDVLQPQT